MNQIKKISIIGTGGVGATLAFNVLAWLAPKELVLIDINEDLAKGVALDLEDTRGFLGFSTKVVGGKNYSTIKNSEIVVFTAGIARKKGMTRLDLLKINSAVAKDVSKKIKKFAPKTIIIVVTNPLDVITYVMAKETKFNRQRVIGMGSSLDTSRLLNILHKATKLPVPSLEGFAYGPHSKDMIIPLQRLKTEGKSITAALKNISPRQIGQRTQLRGAEIVGLLKNRSANFAPALSCCSLIEAIVKNANVVIPVSVYLRGEYGLNNVCLGVPCLINRKGADKIIEMKISSSEKKELKKAEKLFKECMK
ncbi:MAG: malate dehydrogenase [Candidatus Omnitrophica bacterium]|nr:malate dehydrogenase [Candidatus Omnitrophota bacterium]